jgi:hypothetical protein
MNIQKILYINAGFHIDPVIHYPNTKEFIFTDVLPRREIDKGSYDRKTYKKYFLSELIEIYKRHNFILMEMIDLDNSYYKKIINPCKRLYYWIRNNMPIYINPTLLIFFNDKSTQTIRYYISTNTLYNMNEMLSLDINTSDAVITTKYFTNVEIFNFFIKPKIFIGYHITRDSYDNKLRSENEPINNSIFFNKYYYVNYNRGNIIKCNNFKDFIQHVNFNNMIE